MSEREEQEPLERIDEALDSPDQAQLKDALKAVELEALAPVLIRLDAEEQARVIAELPAEQAAVVVQELPEAQVAEVLDELKPEQVAPIVDQLPSDEQADLLGRLEDRDADAILGKMRPEEAEDARRLGKYPRDTAGGLRITEYLAYREDQPVGELIDDLRAHQERYRKYDVQYVYVIDTQGRLKGVVSFRDLFFHNRTDSPSKLIQGKPLALQTDDRRAGRGPQAMRDEARASVNGWLVCQINLLSK